MFAPLVAVGLRRLVVSCTVALCAFGCVGEADNAGNKGSGYPGATPATDHAVTSGGAGAGGRDNPGTGATFGGGDGMGGVGGRAVMAGRGGTVGSSGAGGAGRGGAGTGAAGSDGAGGTTSPAGSADGGAGNAPTFTAVYNDVLVPSCSGGQCHNPGAQQGVSFANKATAYSAMSSRAVAGSAQLSSVYVIMSLGLMPPGAPVSASKLAEVAAWINAGALNN